MDFKGITEKFAAEYREYVLAKNRVWTVERMGMVLEYLKAIQADDLAKKAAELGDAIATLPPTKETYA